MVVGSVCGINAVHCVCEPWYCTTPGGQKNTIFFIHTDSCADYMHQLMHRVNFGYKKFRFCALKNPIYVIHHNRNMLRILTYKLVQSVAWDLIH